jgi:hypothetical protein
VSDSQHGKTGLARPGRALDAATTLDGRRNAAMLHCPRQQRTGAGVVYFEDEPGRRAAKLGFGKLRLHDLRGSHGTNLLRKGRAD